MSILNTFLVNGKDPVVQPLTVTENGTTVAPAGVDGFSPVNVNVPPPIKTFAGNFSTASGTRLIQGRYVTGLSAAAGSFDPRTPEDAVPEYDFSKPFHIRVRFSASGLTASGQGQSLIGAEGGGTTQVTRPAILINTASSASFAEGRFSTSGTAWTTTLSVTKEEMPFVADAWYTVDYSWENGIFTFAVSDGTNTITKTAETAAFYADGTQRIAIGKGLGYANNCTVDLYNTYWEQDGVLIWGNKL